MTNNFTILIILSITLIFIIILRILIFKLNASKRRLDYLKHYQFPTAIKTTLLKKYPHLNDEQIEMVFKALRGYFYICYKADKRILTMPSKIVDEAWQAFILCTNDYQIFCHKMMYKFLRHTPVDETQTPTLDQKNTISTWRSACKKEGINASKPHKLPLLFAIDELLDIKNGFKYTLDITKQVNYSSKSTATPHHTAYSDFSGDSISNGDDSSCIVDSSSYSYSDSGGGSCGGD